MRYTRLGADVPVLKEMLGHSTVEQSLTDLGCVGKEQARPLNCARDRKQKQLAAESVAKANEVPD